MMQIAVKAGPGEGARITDFFEQLLQKVRGLPGVKSVAVADGLPILRDANWAPFNIEGRPPPEPGNQTWAIRYTVSSEYFQTLGIQLLKGRGFTAQDTLNSPPVAPTSAEVNSLNCMSYGPFASLPASVRRPW
jgi:hypothetical protein